MKLKNVFLAILLIILINGSIYAVFAFGEWNLSAGCWAPLSRGFCSFLLAIGIVAGVAGSGSIQIDKK